MCQRGHWIAFNELRRLKASARGCALAPLRAEAAGPITMGSGASCPLASPGSTHWGRTQRFWFFPTETPLPSVSQLSATHQDHSSTLQTMAPVPPARIPRNSWSRVYRSGDGNREKNISGFLCFYGRPSQGHDLHRLPPRTASSSPPAAESLAQKCFLSRGGSSKSLIFRQETNPKRNVREVASPEQPREAAQGHRVQRPERGRTGEARSSPLPQILLPPQTLPTDVLG